MADRLAETQWWVLVAAVAATPLAFSTWTLDIFNLTALTVLWLALTAAAALELALGGTHLRRLPWMAPVVAAYAAVLVLTTVTSRAPTVSALGNYGRYGGLATTLPVILLAWLVAATAARSPDRIRQLAGAVVISAVAGSSYLWFQQADVESVLGWDLPGWLRPWTDAPRHPPGALGNSNFSGAHAALGLGPAAAMALTGTPRRWWWTAGAVVCASGVAVSQSRGAILAAVAAVAVIAVPHRVGRRAVGMGALGIGTILVGIVAADRPVIGVAIALAVAITMVRWPQARGAVVAGLLGAAVLVAATLVVASTSTVDDGLDELLSTSTWEERIDLWEVALEGARDRPILGGGPDLYRLTFGDHPRPSLSGVVSDEPHNVLLDHLDGSGLLGAAAWLGVVAAVIATMTRSDAGLSVLPWASMGAAYLTQAMVSIDVVPLQLWGWIAVAGIVSVSEPRATEQRPVSLRPPLVAAALVGAVVLGAVAIGPFRADMAHRRGIEAANAGDDDLALAQLRLAVDRHGWEPRFHRRLGIQLTLAAGRAGDPELTAEARRELVRALDLLPDDRVAQDWLASLPD